MPEPLKKGLYVWSEDLELTGLLDWSQVYVVEFDGAEPKLVLKSGYDKGQDKEIGVPSGTQKK